MSLKGAMLQSDKVTEYFQPLSATALQTLLSYFVLFSQTIAELIGVLASVYWISSGKKQQFVETAFL